MLSDLSQQFVGEAKKLIPFFEDPLVTDVLINGLKGVFVEKNGNLIEIPSVFSKEEALYCFVERLLVANHRQIDAAAPYLDGSLLDGSRFNIVLPPLAAPGPLISIRKSAQNKIISLTQFGPSELVHWILDKVKAQKTFLISGGTGVGKTTFLSSLLAEACAQERVVVIEEVSEIQIPIPHLIHLQSRTASPDGRGAVTLRTLVRTALRVRPDRLILGECRGAEAFDMLQAMNTGHGGSLGTLHANSARGALRRFESMALLAGLESPLKVIRDWISSEVFGIIHLEKNEGVRQIAEVILLRGLEGEIYRVESYYRK